MKRSDDTSDFATGPEAAGPLFEAPPEHRDDPFAYSKQEPTPMERVVAGMIWRHRGRARPVTIETLVAVSGLDPRGVKGVVQQLVTAHQMLIGAKREGPHGYFMICDGEDLDAACRPYEAQAMSMLERLSRMRKMAAARGICGQERLAG